MLNESETLSARRYLTNPSLMAKDEFSIRCEDERSGSVFHGFIIALLVKYKPEEPPPRCKRCILE